MKGKKWKPNFFDIVIVVVVLALAGGVYMFTKKETKVDTKLITYQLEITECPVGISEKIEIGTDLTDNVKNYYMGKVKDVLVKPTVRLGDNKLDGIIVESVLDGFEDVIITVEAEVTESESQFLVPGGYVVRAGKDVAIKGKGFTGRGYILSIER